MQLFITLSALLHQTASKCLCPLFLIDCFIFSLNGFVLFCLPKSYYCVCHNNPVIPQRSIQSDLIHFKERCSSSWTVFAHNIQGFTTQQQNLIWMGLKLNQNDNVYFKKDKTQSKIIISNILFSSNDLKKGLGKKKLQLVEYVVKCLQLLSAFTRVLLIWECCDFLGHRSKKTTLVTAYSWQSYWPPSGMNLLVKPVLFNFHMFSMLMAGPSLIDGLADFIRLFCTFLSNFSFSSHLPHGNRDIILIYIVFSL